MKLMVIFMVVVCLYLFDFKKGMKVFMCIFIFFFVFIMFLDKLLVWYGVIVVILKYMLLLFCLYLLKLDVMFLVLFCFRVLF